MVGRPKRIIGLGLFLLFSVGMAYGRHPKIASDLERVSSSNSDVKVIVTFKHFPTDAHHRLVTDRGGRINRKLEVINSGAYTLPASALEDLADRTRWPTSRLTVPWPSCWITLRLP